MPPPNLTQLKKVMEEYKQLYGSIPLSVRRLYNFLVKNAHPDNMDLLNKMVKALTIADNPPMADNPPYPLGSHNTLPM